MAKNKTKAAKEDWMTRGPMTCRGTRVTSGDDVGYLEDCGTDLRETIWEAIPEKSGPFTYKCPDCGREGHGSHIWPE